MPLPLKIAIIDQKNKILNLDFIGFTCLFLQEKKHFCAFSSQKETKNNTEKSIVTSYYGFCTKSPIQWLPKLLKHYRVVL